MATFKLSWRIFSVLLLVGMIFSFIQPVAAVSDLDKADASPPIRNLSAGIDATNASGAISTYPSGKVIVSEPVVPKISRAIRDLPVSVPQGEKREIPLRNFFGDSSKLGLDSAIQDPLAKGGVSEFNTPDPMLSFEGMGDFEYLTPPDTTGDVGPEHYFQIVNVFFAIYDKSGNLLAGPTANNELWSGAGYPCETMNNGDPIVLYDDMAARWMVSQFAVEGTPQYQCIAISTTADPLGTYYLYAFPMPDFPDYPKFGVWLDAYYMGTNTGFPNAYYAHAFDRAAMLAGDPATSQSFGGYANFLLPADADGLNPPPAGSPGYFYTFYDEGYPNHPPGVDRLAIYEFDVDWVNPGNSTFGLVTEIPIADYNYTVCGFFVGDCIPQPGTAQGLDSLSYWPMVRLQYRNFLAYETLVGNFTVDLDGTDKAAIRWFELQKQGVDPWSLYQEGTYAPDSEHRWMGSIAMDGSGNIALGYSVGSSDTKPAIRYAVRLKNDPLGTLQTEASLMEGTGVQTGIHRWGDYSAMNVDPVDQCTFWLTNEYHDVDSEGWGWNTRIGAFRIPSCTGSIGPTGEIEGTVVDAVTTDPITGASIDGSNIITPTYTFNATTNPSGFYQAIVGVGVYTVTASAFGYYPETIYGVEIISGGLTIQNFALDPTPSVIVEGVVSDANTGWPLYAVISIAGTPYDEVWTDPVTGYYQVSLPTGAAYDFHVEAFVQGYIPTDMNVPVPGPGNVTQNFSLDVDALACSAPGYQFGAGAAYSEDFEADNGGFSTSGTTTWEWGMPTSGPGTAHSGVNVWATNLEGNYNDYEDGYITSPLIDLSAYSGQTIILYWWQWLQTESGYDYASVEVSNNGGSSWSVVYGPFDGNVDLIWAEHNVFLDSSYAVSNFQVRFHFITDVSVTYPGWYVDDISISAGDCEPQPGGLVAGQVYDGDLGVPLTGAEVSNEAGYATMTFATPDPAVDDGFYTLFSPAGTQNFTASYPGYFPETEPVEVLLGETVEHNFTLSTGTQPQISISPTVLESTQLPVLTTQPLTITNLGDLDLSWTLFEEGEPGGALLVDWFDNFDSYDVGSNMHGQGDWKGWDNNPAAGALVTDVQAHSVPNSVAIVDASDLVHEYSGYDSGTWTYTAWQYIPDDFSGESYFIMLNEYNDFGPYNWSVQVMFDGASGIVTNPGVSGGSLPMITDQWVEIRLEIDLDLDLTSFYYDDALLYAGTWTNEFGSSGELNIAAVDLFANGASTVYYDDISLVGPYVVCDVASDVDWLSATPDNGITPGGESSLVEVGFDATGKPIGIYTATLCAASNDLLNPLIPIPVTMTVEAFVYGVELTPEDVAQSGAPGDTVDYSLQLTNNGNYTNTFELEYAGNVWDVVLPITTTTLAAGESVEVAVQVAIPAGALDGEMDSVTVSVTSVGDDPVTDQSVITTTAVIPAVYGVEVTPSEAAQSGAPGETVMYTLTVMNSGNITDTYAITGTALWDFHLPVIELTLGGGESAEVVVHVTIPDDAVDGNSDVVAIVVTGMSEVMDTATLTTTAVVEEQNIFLPLLLKNYSVP